MDSTAYLIGFAAAALAFAGLGAWICTQKRRGPAEGFVLGLVFGPLGVLVVALLPTGTGSGSAARRVAIDGDYVPPRNPRRLNPAERHRERLRERERAELAKLPEVPAEDMERWLKGSS